MEKQLIIAIGEIISIVTAVILFFLGLQCWIKSLKLEDETRIRQLFKRSIILLIIAIMCYSISRFFVIMGKNPQLELTEASFFSLCLSSLIEGIKNTGFIVFLPILVKPKKKH